MPTVLRVKVVASRRLVKLADRPIILAGGLTPENVKRAILEARPAGVDFHTGVEVPKSRFDPAPHC